MTASTRARSDSKPALLTVDDDPAVSRSVARDLRRRYGADYRVVRADSGADALDALREMKLRGDQVAVLLADYRMPAMSGLEFLEQAMDLFPAARRVLLTAYADTDAAIEAINVVDLDYYLLKPWDPPEEKLYPVIDAQLESWLSSDHQPVPETKIIGHRWSAPSSAARDFLARNQVSYRWFNSDEPEGERILSAAGVDAARLPVIVTAEREVLIEPSDAQLAEKVGLVTSAASEFYDVVVIGGGPAGLGAAVYASSEGLRTVLVERIATGGQAGQSSRIENYLGFPDGVSGAQLTDRARRQALKFGSELLTTRDAVSIDTGGTSRIVRFADGGEIAAHTVILATGVSYRQLDKPGLEELTGRGVFYGSALAEAMNCVGDDVYIVGGANSAGQAAVYFARSAATVHLVVRAPTLAVSMSHYLVQQIEALPNIVVHACSEVVGAAGDEHLESLQLQDNSKGIAETVTAHWLFIFIGAIPRTEWLDVSIRRDTRGFVLAGPDLRADGRSLDGWPLDREPYHLETSVPGVFVAGDVRSASVKRVASAVGEGAMAVTLIHRYLERL